MYERELCISEPFWGYSLMVYNLFLLLLSATLVFFRGRREGDKIAGTAAAMNESTHVAVAVYNTFVLSIAGFAFTFIPDPGIQYALVTLTIVAATTVVVCLMFLPKVCLCLPCTS